MVIKNATAGTKPTLVRPRWDTNNVMGLISNILLVRCVARLTDFDLPCTCRNFVVNDIGIPNNQALEGDAALNQLLGGKKNTSSGFVGV